MFLLFPSAVASDSGRQPLSHLFMSLDLFLARSADSTIRFSQSLWLSFLPSWLLEFIRRPCRTVPKSRKTSKYYITNTIQYTKYCFVKWQERMKFFVCVSVWEQRCCAGPSSLCLYVSQRCPGTTTQSQSSADYVLCPVAAFPVELLLCMVTHVAFSDLMNAFWGCLTAAASIHRQTNHWDERGGQPGGHPADGSD